MVASSDSFGRKPASDLRLQESADAGGDELYLADYLLEKEIGHGGMGVVYRARQVSLGRVVAVKVLLLGRYSSAGTVERFRREAQAVAALRHPQIVSIYDVGECDGQHFFAMEYVAGRSLAERLREGPMPPRRAAEIVRDIARAIGYAHQQGILHRDLKPSNVLLDLLGGVHITDFGLAKRLDESSDLTVTGQLVGTPNYLSPEQADGKRGKLGPTTDVYAMGALLYELLTGRPPFLAQSLQETLQRICDAEPVWLRSLNPGIPRDLETICLKCLHKEPGRRYASAPLLADDLQRWLEQRPIEARPVGQAERLWLWCRRHPRQAALLTSLVLVVASGIAGVSWEWRRAERHRLLAEDRSRKLEAERTVARQQLYASDIAAAFAAYKDGNFGSVLLLLRRQQPAAPSSGALDPPTEADLRGFEWRYLWNRVQGDQTQILSGHGNMVSCLAFSPDGHFLVSGDADGVVKWWDLRTGQCLSNLWRFHGRALSASFSHDGRSVALGSWEEVRIWNEAVHNWTRVEKLGQGRVLCSPVDSTMAVSSERFYWFGSGGEARLWNNAGDINARRLRRSGARLSFSADGRWLATGLEDRQIHFWQVADGMSAGHAGEAYMLRGLALGRAATWVAASVDDRPGIAVWSVPDGVRQADLLGHELRVTALASSPVAELLASSGEDQKIRLWDMEEGRLLSTWSGHGSEVHALAFSRDGQWLASGSKDDTVRLWKVATNHLSGLVQDSSTHGGLQIPLLTPDGRWLAANNTTNVLTLFDASTQRPVRTFGPDRHPLAFSPDGAILYTITTGGLMESWAVQTGELKGALLLPAKPHRESRCCLSPDGSQLAVSTGMKMVLCDSRDGTVRFTLAGHGGLILGAAYSRDGRSLATVAQDGVVRLWRTADGVLEVALSGHKADVRGVDFAPGDRWLATSGHDNLIKVWDLEARAELVTLRGHKAAVHGLAFTPDGRTLISAGDDALRLWNVATWREIGPIQTGERRQLLHLSAHGDVLVTGDAAEGHPPLHVIAASGWASIEPERNAAWEPPHAPPWSLGHLPPLQQLVFRAERVPPRNASTPTNCLDLSKYYNCQQTAPFHGLPPHSNTLPKFPPAPQRWEGPAWDARGIIALRAIHQADKPYRFPAAVREIPIQRLVTRAHFLCGASDSGNQTKEIGRIAFRSADDQISERPLWVGKDLMDWWYPLAESPHRRGMTVAWTGTNAVSLFNKHGLRLFRVTWENPRPEVPVDTLDLVAAPTRAELLFLAITLE
jgi:WD40 repeat protein/predicted Ser/Thr protein kinase